VAKKIRPFTVLTAIVKLGVFNSI